MQKLIARIWAPLALVVDALLVIDIATDLIRKYKDRKNGKKQTESTVEEPVPATEEA